MHSYARFKLALTEKKPTIKDYPEALWADLNEAHHKDSITSNLQMIIGIHFRWGGVLKTMTLTDFEKVFNILKPNPSPASPSVSILQLALRTPSRSS